MKPTQHDVNAQRFHEEHPEVLDEIVARIRETVAAGRNVAFGAMVKNLTTHTLNNNHRTWYARRIAALFPELAPYLMIRNRPPSTSVRARIDPITAPGDPLVLWEHIVDNSLNTHVQARLANDAEEAAARGDNSWFTQHEKVLAGVAVELEALHNILADPVYRRRIAAGPRPVVK